MTIESKLDELVLPLPLPQWEPLFPCGCYQQAISVLRKARVLVADRKRDFICHAIVECCDDDRMIYMLCQSIMDAIYPSRTYYGWALDHGGMRFLCTGDWWIELTMCKVAWIDQMIKKLEDRLGVKKEPMEIKL